MERKQIRVLLIEDNPGDVRLIKEMLREADPVHFKLESADQLSEGLKLIAKGGFDLLLLDLGLADSQGIETLKKAQAKTSGIPIIVLTGLADEMVGINAVQEGAQDYLMKGQIDGVLLVRTIRYAIERKRAEETLRREKTFTETALNILRDVFFVLDLEGRLLRWNKTLNEITGYSDTEISSMKATDFFPEEDVQPIQQAIELVMTKGSARVEANVLTKDGGKIPFEFSGTQFKDSEGRTIGVSGIGRDMTERKRVEEVLKESEKKYKNLVDNALVGVFKTNLKGDILYTNDALVKMLEFESSKEFMAEGALKRYKNPKDREVLFGILKERGRVEKFDTEILTKGGKIKNVFMSATLEADVLSGILMDITELKQTEQEMASLQEQLQQSQKMEAIGQLAGGIAHDFNNLLTVIKGYSQLSLLGFKEGDPLRGNLEEIKNAADKAADLTHRLLAFSRRQILDRKVLDFNIVLRNLEKMLRRVIGEDIELVMHLPKDLGRVKTDPGQIEQVIMNLAVNAKDAMPDGGKLTIETANLDLDEEYTRNHIAVTPGRYVMLAVSDTGVGMTAEIKEKAFEPFFTTKKKGEGTGLGLSTVYGIVKQSEGNIWVYSEPGKGTTLKIYLPRVDEPLDEIRKEGVVKEGLLRGSETILVVEDEEVVLKLAVRILQEQGYRVLEAAQGMDAFLIAEEHQGAIHLLVTDVVMPKMSGRELAERLASLRPGTKVLYMSGYTDNTIAHHGILDKGVNYIQKPFTVDGLAKKVREVLDK